ncbi:MAG: hypothetical protein Fur0022_41710 [Anaerolineales bacterium]
MEWRDYIYSDPEILLGKPIVKGTRLAVDFILRLFANGWTEQQVFRKLPKFKFREASRGVRFCRRISKRLYSICSPS